MNQIIYDKLVHIVGSENVRADELMKKHTTFKIGGPADFFVTPCDVIAVSELIKLCREEKIPYFIMGNGSNLLVSDAGFRGVVIQIFDKLNEITWDEENATVSVMAGCLMSKLGNEAARKGFSGFEFGTGIPGTFGGAVSMNAGAYGGEISDIIIEARMMDADGNIRWYAKDELELGYRKSAANKYNLLVLEARLQLTKSTTESVQEKIKELAYLRKSKQPLEYPSAGSTFKRPEGHFAGKLIEDAGLKGFKHGGAMVSHKHSGFVINAENATAKDVIELIEIVKSEVKKQFGIELELEVKCLGDF